MIEIVGPILGASLLGSPHCATMCGGFVCFYAGSGPNRPLSHVAYNLGRLTSYVLFGALAGVVGAGLNHAGVRAGVTGAAAIAAGVFMIVWGVGQLLVARGVRGWDGGVARGAHRLIASVLRRLAERPPAVRALTLGLVTTLLPCGFLHVFVATAAGTGSPARGALVMAAFWLGTVPVMATIGIAAQRAFGPLRARLPFATAVVLIAIGTLTVIGKLPLAAATTGAAHGCH